jgi:carbamoyltransferase
VVRQTGCRKLVVGGGSAYNCSVNGLLRALPEIDDVFVFPASGDAGTSLGAALAVAGAHTGLPDSSPLDHAAFGPRFDDDDIATLLRDSGVPARRSPDVAAEAAGLLAAGRVIGWFQGRAELGPRALGHRSILATPSSRGVRDRVNAIKGREAWRPLAPSLLAEAAPTYLADPRPAPFMLTATTVREEVRDQVAGIVHVDGSCRPQTVQRDSGTRYADLLARLDELTGVPVVLNTSFNIGDEPIVLSPRDAVRSFAVSGLDALVIGDSVVVKAAADH